MDLGISEENVGKKHYRRMGGKVNIVLAGDKFYPLRQLIHEIVFHISGLFSRGRWYGRWRRPDWRFPRGSERLAAWALKNRKGEDFSQ